MASVLSPSRSSGTVMASIDEDAEEERYIIADVSRDEAWISMPRASAPALARWR